ncbi:MAG: conserved membrane protein of unknown function [Nitrospira sp.]|nr:hypothetical protein [Nitrospira sp.]ULA58784.1 MAG: conserved membrane protein of unknown function [Nitrospira sp.]
MGRRGWRRNEAWVWASALGFCCLGYAGIGAEAGSLYVYTDAQGQAVLTDNLDQVPAAYRGRVRTMTGTDSPAPALVPAPAVTEGKKLPSSGLISDFLSAVAAKVGSRTIKGLTAYQTAVVIVAGVSSLVLLTLMFLSGNPAIRILCKFLLVLVGVAALYQVIAIDAPSLEALAGPPQQSTGQPVDNMLGRMRSQTEQSYRAQDERTARQLEPAEQPTP